MGSYSKSPTSNSAQIASIAGQYASAEAAYSAASTGAANSDVNSSLAFVGQEIQYNSSEDWWDCFVYESFVEFETPETGTVTAATLKVWLDFDYSTTDFNIEVFAYDFDTAVNVGDFRTPTQLTGLTSVGSLSTSGIGSTGALKSITLNTSSINRSGPTRLVLASSRHRTATQPTGSESVSLTPFSNWVLEYTTDGNDLAATSRNRIGVVTKAQPGAANDLTVSSRTQVGAVTRSTVQPAPSVSSVAEVGAVTRSTVQPELSVGSCTQVGAVTRSQPTVLNDVTVDARTQVGTTTRSQPTVTVSVSAATQVGAVTRSTVQPAPSVSSRTQVGITTRSQPTVTVSVSALVEVGAVLKVSGDLVASVPGTAAATFAAPTATATFAAPIATATITAPTATMTFSKEP